MPNHSRQAGLLQSFLDSLPRLLGADSLRNVVDAVVLAREKRRPVVLAMGGHVIKCGLQPVLKSLIDADVITAVAMNGSATIHDFEVSLVGATSEEVGDVLHSGDFGFSEETGSGMNQALKVRHGKRCWFWSSYRRVDCQSSASVYGAQFARHLC